MLTYKKQIKYIRLTLHIADYNLQKNILRHTLVIYSVVLSLSLERTILQNLFRRKDRKNTNRPRYKLEYSSGNKVL